MYKLVNDKREAHRLQAMGLSCHPDNRKGAPCFSGAGNCVFVGFAYRWYTVCMKLIAQLKLLAPPEETRRQGTTFRRRCESRHQQADRTNCARHRTRDCARRPHAHPHAGNRPTQPTSDSAQLVVRKSQDRFSCTACGLVGRADYIAAVNISRRALVNAPHVSTGEIDFRSPASGTSLPL